MLGGQCGSKDSGPTRNPIPTGKLLGQEIQWGVGLLGRSDAPSPPEGRNFFLFVLSSFFFKKHKHMAGMVRGPCLGGVCSSFAFYVVIVFFFHQLQGPAGT